jgi:two-component system phosphate regulon sensor histidine kinase PhoR
LANVAAGVTGIGEGDNNEELKRQLAAYQQRVKELEAEKNLPATPAPRVGGGESVIDAPLNEADVTLRRLVQRIAMILQAEKIVIMFYDREIGELIGIPPAYGVDDEHLKLFRVRASQGLSGQVFRESEAVIFHDANTDPRTQKDPFGLLHVQNGVTVPLVIEKRDEENRVVERNTIGVLHAFNKRHGEDFNDEDVRLLERMARNVGSIIANLQLYREVVEEREELLQTFESLSAGLFLVSPEGRLSQINATARTIFSLSADALGKSAKDVLHNDELWTVLNEAHKGGEGNKSEIHVSIQNSERIYEVQAAQVRGEDGKDLGVVAILNDITDMRNIDRMKSSFVAMASHELRTPLTAIKGFTSTLLMDDGFSPDERREFLMIIDHECDRLRRLIDDLLNTARIEAGESLKPNYTTVDINTLLDKVVRVQQQASSKHTVKLKIHSPLPDQIVADEDKLDQIFTNLLNNAIKYSPNGGDVTVHATNEGETLLFGVQDQGLGIPKDHLGKVFEKFHRVNNEDNRKIYGTGLGLYLVKHLVDEVHQGKIWADSEVGVGSTFLFRIPSKLDIEKAKEAGQ